MSSSIEQMRHAVSVPPALPATWRWVPLVEVCRPRQWPTISREQLLAEGYVVYGANGPIGFYSEYTHAERTIAITCRGATCGVVNLVPPRSYITGNAMALDELDIRRVTLDYLCHTLRYRGFADVISGSAQPQITRQGLAPVLLPVPAVAEQRKIAAILSSVDDVIAATQAVVDQLQVVKKAMVAELLTRGLPGRHARFKQTEIGQVPEAWEVRPTGDALAKLSVGVRYEKRTVVDAGTVPVLDQSREGILGYHNDSPGIGASPAAPVVTFANHTCAVRWLTAPFSVIQNVFPLRGAAGVQTRFLYHALPGRVVPSGYKGHWPDLMETFMPVPSEAEQIDMVRLFDAIEERLGTEAGTLLALNAARSALMSVLLTGELRVTPDPEPA